MRLLLYVLGAFSIFCFFFSLIGVLIGTLYFALLHDRRWRLHGLALALCAAISEFAAHTGTALEPLRLAMRTGPMILACYLLAQFLAAALLRRKRRTSWIAVRLSGIGRLVRLLWTKAAAPLTLILILFPIGLWASVSLHLGVLLDNTPRMLWVHAPSTVTVGEPFPFSVQAWDAYERLSAVYRGTVQFAAESYSPDGKALGNSNLSEAAPCELPPPYTFRGANRGSGMAYRLRNGKDNGNKVFPVSYTHLTLPTIYSV